MKAQALAVLALLIASPAYAKTYKVKPGPQAQAEIAGAFAVLKPGDRLALDKGRFELTSGFGGAVSAFSLRGAGAGNTILSFTGQTAPGACVTLSGDKIELRGFSVENCHGDAIKTSKANTVSFRELSVQWTAPAGGEASGIVAEETQNALVDNVVARGATKAGLLLSQSQSIVVQNSMFAQNTIGAAIESSVAVDLMRSTATKNAVGVAVYDMPGKAAGRNTRITKNQISGNDAANSAPEGTAAASLPGGVGVLLTATRDTAVLDNEIGENGAVNLMLMAWRAGASDPKFSALPRNITIGDNRFGRTGFAPTGDLKTLAGQGVKLPDILWDGADTYFAGNAPRQEPVLIAINRNKSLTGSGPSFLNLGLVTAGSDFGDAQPSAIPPPLSNVAEPPPVKLTGGL